VAVQDDAHGAAVSRGVAAGDGGIFRVWRGFLAGFGVVESPRVGEFGGWVGDFWGRRCEVGVE